MNLVLSLGLQPRFWDSNPDSTQKELGSQNFRSSCISLTPKSGLQPDLMVKSTWINLSLIDPHSVSLERGEEKPPRTLRDQTLRRNPEEGWQCDPSRDTMVVKNMNKHILSFRRKKNKAKKTKLWWCESKIMIAAWLEPVWRLPTEC